METIAGYAVLGLIAIGSVLYALKLREENARLDEQAAGLRRDKAELEETEQKLRETFKALSSDALRSNNEAFLQLAEQKQDATLQPVLETLRRFGGLLSELEKDRNQAYAELRTRVGSLQSAQDSLQNETRRLVDALKHRGNRGHWGELQLRRVVELAGMLEHCDFATQYSVAGEDGRLRPDMVVHLPGAKRIVVDAKAPMDAYLRAVEEDDETRRMEALRQHAAQVRDHIAKLSAKAYWRQFDSMPEFVFMFLPGESILSAALQQEPSLIEAGTEHRVILATPTTLIALLKTVSYGWQQEKLAENAQRISTMGGELYDALAVMSGHVSKVGSSLKAAVEHYNRLVGSTERRVAPKAKRLRELGVGAKKELVEPEPIDSVPRRLDAVTLVERATVVRIDSGKPPTLDAS